MPAQLDRPLVSRHILPARGPLYFVGFLGGGDLLSVKFGARLLSRFKLIDPLLQTCQLRLERTSSPVFGKGMRISLNLSGILCIEKRQATQGRLRKRRFPTASNKPVLFGTEGCLQAILSRILLRDNFRKKSLTQR